MSLTTPNPSRFELHHRPTTERGPIQAWTFTGTDFVSFGDALCEGERLQAADRRLEFQIKEDGEEVYFEDALCVSEDDALEDEDGPTGERCDVCAIRLAEYDTGSVCVGCTTEANEASA